MDRKDWLEDEEVLPEPIRRLRALLAEERSPELRRQRLMAEFGRLHRRPGGWLAFATGMAAAALLALAVTLVWRGAPESAQRTGIEVAQPGIWNHVLDGSMDENGFAPIPYAMPLAAGECIRVMRTEVTGAALAQMGLSLPWGYENDFDVDILLGDDGFPRAVRMVGNAEL